jgi:hypothetical protein
MCIFMCVVSIYDVWYVRMDSLCVVFHAVDDMLCVYICVDV